MSNPMKPQWVIEKGQKAGRPRKYDWAGIKVGETLVVLKQDQSCAWRSFYVMAMKAASELGRTFHCRIRPVDEAFEVWRER